MSDLTLNDRAGELVAQIIADRIALRIAVQPTDSGARVIDFGIEARGGLEAGIRLSEVCMAGLGRVQLSTAAGELGGGPAVVVRTDHPVPACMASQYAGWQIALDDYFAMGSGPMRAAAGNEELFDAIGNREKPTAVVGVLETAKYPNDAVAQYIAQRCGVAPRNVTLLVAPTASQAATVQIVSRIVETALHKMHELGFDLHRVESSWGSVPLPAVAKNDLEGIGRTNDAILYGGRAVLWVRGDDDTLADLGPRIPSCASSDFGRPFLDIFEAYDRDFYKIDPHLFSPAIVTLCNLDTGRTFHFGQLRPDVLQRSLTE